MPVVWHVISPVFFQDFAIFAKRFVSEVEPTFRREGAKRQSFQERGSRALGSGLSCMILIFGEG